MSHTLSDPDLQERLKRLGLSRGIQAIRSPARQRKDIEDLIPGEIVRTSQGEFFLHRELFALQHRHGQHRLSDLLNHPQSAAAELARDERLASIDPGRIVFLDTETTGLAGGTGTCVFLVGVGAFEPEGFAIHQFFMRDFDEQSAQLEALGELLDRYDAVVSFNGKQFDLPLLETRFLLAEQRPRLIGLPHLDLLTTARAFWRHRLESCALSSLEAEVLGVQRTQADVPGWLIPSLYVEYARSGNAREMPRIFYHNAQDVLSLVTLAAKQCELLGAPLSPEMEVPGEDLYGLGRFLHDLGHLERAELALRRSARTSHSPEVRGSAIRELAYLLKRQGRRHEALAWWQELVETECAVYACEELAKHYEWQEVSLPEALAWTERALASVRAWPPGPRRREALSELEHRLERVRLKLRMSQDSP